MTSLSVTLLGGLTEVLCRYNRPTDRRTSLVAVNIITHVEEDGEKPFGILKNLKHLQSHPKHYISLLDIFIEGACA